MDKVQEDINLIFKKLINTYSPQGWWPHIEFDGKNYTKTGSIQGYNQGNYEFPRNEIERFEIIMGSILTQNTSWTSVEKALLNLNELIEFTPKSLLDFADSNVDKFKEAIKPSGYYNQKFNYLVNISNFLIKLNGKTPSRSEILEVKGVGDETADTILLYAYKEKQFVVDAYTKRMFSYLGILNEKDSYLKIKNLFEDNFNGDFQDFQEYHALIVEHGKRYYSKKPYGINDKLLKEFKR
ncbi:endonuclease III domain-containing protein [Methanobrevibacter sp. DSM 116169]|uniref:endonuclease III domain-containing protein n=1 Tax=Methanobrevibacter sp. DSM 116169 TaxID=3242727 RepID=UPI0038FC64C6